MSTWADQTLTCPACGAGVRARIAVGAHVGRAPHVREWVLARQLHRFACTCGASVAVDTAFEYMDFERRQLCLVGRAVERSSWRDHERRLQETVNRALVLGSPLATRFVHDLTPRVVFGVEALREKLVLADAALDDAIVECIKARAIANDVSLASPDGRIVVDVVTPGDALACLWFPAIDGPPESRFEVPASWVSAALDDRASLEARFPELFRGGYVDIDRLRSA